MRWSVVLDGLIGWVGLAAPPRCGSPSELRPRACSATGRKLWQSSTITGSVYALATVVNGRVFIPARSGKLYAFGVAKS